jgi:hypothetical protein
MAEFKVYEERKDSPDTLRFVLEQDGREIVVKAVDADGDEIDAPYLISFGPDGITVYHDFGRAADLGRTKSRIPITNSGDL